MSDVITALQADPSDPEKVHVFIDGKHAIAVALDVAAAERLTVGQPCPPEKLERLHEAQELQQVFETALNFLSYRPRSTREVEMRLRKKGHTPEEIDAVMDRLRKRGYVNDEDFARFWVGNRMAFNPRGPRLLRSELRQKGVSQEVVDVVLQEQTEAQQEAVQQAAEVSEAYGLEDDDDVVPGTDLANALALARKKWRTYGRLDPLVAKRRLAGFLARRGYNYDTIDGVTRRLLAEEDGESYSDD
jgi:regulatory protein